MTDCIGTAFPSARERLEESVENCRWLRSAHFRARRTVTDRDSSTHLKIRKTLIRAWTSLPLSLSMFTFVTYTTSARCCECEYNCRFSSSSFSLSPSLSTLIPASKVISSNQHHQREREENDYFPLASLLFIHLDWWICSCTWVNLQIVHRLNDHVYIRASHAHLSNMNTD